MRPRHKAAEYAETRLPQRGESDASMRPRHKAAEYEFPRVTKDKRVY